MKSSYSYVSYINEFLAPRHQKREWVESKKEILKYSKNIQKHPHGWLVDKTYIITPYNKWRNIRYNKWYRYKDIKDLFERYIYANTR